jgi:AcrR family transcriptional regulator
MSARYKHKNRQAIRSIEALQSALITLLEKNPYSKIKITQIAEEANLTRSTFYAHFETKDDLLNGIINDILDDFFQNLYTRDSVTINPEVDLEIDRNFFRVWEKHKNIIPLLHSVDFDCLLVERMISYWKHVSKNKAISSDTPIYSGYIVNYLAYTFVGILKQWIQYDFHPSSDIMGELLYQLTGPPALTEARNIFQDKFDKLESTIP